MGRLEGGGHAPRSKRPVLPNHHSWREVTAGGGGAGAWGQPAGGALDPLNVCLSSPVAALLAGKGFYFFFLALVGQSKAKQWVKGMRGL